MPRWSRRLPFCGNKIKIEASVLLGDRDEEVEVHGESDCWDSGRAASQAYAAAQVDLAIVFLNGTGVDSDIAESYKWALLSRMGGDPRGDAICEIVERDLSAEDRAEGIRRANEFSPQNLDLAL